MGNKFKAEQIVRISVTTTEDIANKWFEWGKERICDDIELDWDYGDDQDEYIFIITIHDTCVYYPGDRWSPDEIDVGDYILPDDANGGIELVYSEYINEFKRESNVPQLIVNTINISDIASIDEPPEYPY